MFTNHLGFRLKTKHKKQDDVANANIKATATFDTLKWPWRLTRRSI